MQKPVKDMLYLHLDSLNTKKSTEKEPWVLPYELVYESTYENSILVKENIQSDEFLRYYLKHYNPDHNFCSHVLVMEKDGKRIYLTDAAMNMNPTLQDLVKITNNAIDFYKKVDHDYKLIQRDLCYNPTIHVNFLTNSGHFDVRNPVSCTGELLKQHYVNQGILDVFLTTWQLDTCLYEEARKAKMAMSPGGTPNIIVVPSIDVGNAIYKALLPYYKTMGFVVGGRTPAVLNTRSNLAANAASIAFLADNYKE